MVNTGENGNHSPSPDAGEIEELNITPKDSGILRSIQEEGLTAFTFDGLRRLLGVHQETLSRVLDRLQDAGLVEKAAEGYTCFRRGTEVVARPLNSSLTRVPAVRAFLPYEVWLSLSPRRKSTTSNHSTWPASEQPARKETLTWPLRLRLRRTILLCRKPHNDQGHQVQEYPRKPQSLLRHRRPTLHQAPATPEPQDTRNRRPGRP